ncbi:C2 calcium-dependent domain-containing protein 4B-like isoform X2 [Larimichthys crocea]|uniref:C2 calcium-dependent domain-containing protein 4B-like isoform X2 n=1 Tax=Larimichthys crocea TaxID=215358 RepID=UPI000F5EEEB3|nr:C2 calcium-dependent domain-containing protein 4B-like isoform X2 [Larimichthys crocea]
MKSLDRTLIRTVDRTLEGWPVISVIGSTCCCSYKAGEQTGEVSRQVIMSAIRTRSTLQNLVLTPERIPAFLIPPRSPLLFLSPRLHRSSPDRTGLLSDHDDDSPGLSPVPRPALLRLPPRVRLPRRSAADADTDLTTRAAMSLPHVGKVTTPYGFRAVLTASPCTHRRESLFHKNKAVPVPDGDLQDPADPDPGPGPGPDPGRSRVPLRLQVLKQLRRPAAALKATRKTRPR